MKFITEENLRDSYKKEPFTIYDIEQGTRLTPGARQFLTDRGIEMIDYGPSIKKPNVIVSQNKISKSNPDKKYNIMQEKQISWRDRKLYDKMKSIEVLFLSTGMEIFNKDIFLAKSIINLGKQFSSIRNFAEGSAPAEILCCQECHGLNKDIFDEDMGDCFDITELHMQLDKGREILELHKLKCELRELEYVVMEVYEYNENKIKLCDEIMGKVNRIINGLSQMICAAAGGEKCQRKS